MIVVIFDVCAYDHITIDFFKTENFIATIICSSNCKPLRFMSRFSQMLKL